MVYRRSISTMPNDEHRPMPLSQAGIDHDITTSFPSIPSRDPQQLTPQEEDNEIALFGRVRIITKLISPGKEWTIDHVLLWLAIKQFSKDWQETFKYLNICGPLFLELGSGHGGRGNFVMMHQQIYPYLAKECSSSGTGWDQVREREEGKRMRRLIRGIVYRCY
jgi:hypothetical protein